MRLHHPLSRSTVALLTTLLLLAFSFSAFAHGGGPRPDKKGILLVAFGTSVPEAQRSFADIEQKVRTAFPDIPVRWAYTSKIIRHKIAKVDNENIDSPAVALARMADEDFTDVAVQSLHTIPGREFHTLVQIAGRFRGAPKGIRHISVGRPLLAYPEDYQAVINALLPELPKDRTPEDAVVLMGHGTHHGGNSCYPALQYYLWQRDPNILVGTVEGSPSLDDVRAELKDRKVRKAYLLPFMSVAGDHARNDMAGDEDDSWLSVLKNDGYECVPVLKGTAEYGPVADIWVDHLRDALKALD